MPFVKVIKNKAYHKRYQVKFKRRRQCKTDYYARKRLIIQDKNKYKTPKYRFVVRNTNKDIVCQVFMADLTHDVCIGSAYSHELKRYGIQTGLTNYAAAYCTGLLLARRVNAKYGLEYQGNVAGSDEEEEINLGEDFNVDEDETESDAKPFCALLDVGLARTTTGARIFGALKGMCDGGIDIPHSNARFPGSVKNGKDIESDPDKHREYIFGQHVAAHMRHRQEKDDGSYEKQFSSYITNKIGPDDIEDMYAKAHAAIRANPAVARAATEKGYFHTRSGPKPTTFVKNKKTYSKRNLSQRRDRIRQKLLAQGKTSLVGM